MALETLKGVTEIGGESIVIMDDLREKYPDKFEPSGQMNWEWFEKEIRPNYFVYVRHDKNSVSFTIQNGPIKENGKNGCQVDTMIAVAKHIIEGLDNKFPCNENKLAVASLDEALACLLKRKENREKRGVEGTSQA